MFSKTLYVSLSSAVILTACGNSSQPQDSQSSPDAAIVSVPMPEIVDDAPETDIEIATADTEAETVTPEVRQADSHVHGDASLAIVLEDAALTLELETPLYNLTGFEHAAETDEQKATMARAEAILGAPGTLFQPNDEAGCVPASETLDVHLAEATDDDHDDHDAHDSDDKHDDHKDEAHDDHEDEAHADGDAHAEHKDVLITYTFSCSNPGALKEIRTGLMSEFSNFADVDVVYLAPGRQDQLTLTSTATTIDLRP